MSQAEPYQGGIPGGVASGEYLGKGLIPDVGSDCGGDKLQNLSPLSFDEGIGNQRGWLCLFLGMECWVGVSRF